MNELEYYGSLVVDDYLEHHGILGMHWGKRNGPPYPLGSAISNGKSLIKKAKAKRQKNAAAKRLKKARKVRSKNIKAEQKSIKKAQRDAKRQARYDRGNDPRKWSQEELNRRIQLEESKKKYSELTGHSKQVSAGKSAVADVLSSSAKQAAKVVLTGALVYAGKAAVSTYFGQKYDENTRNLVKTFYPEKKK